MKRRVHVFVVALWMNVSPGLVSAAAQISFGYRWDGLDNVPESEFNDDLGHDSGLSIRGAAARFSYAPSPEREYEIEHESLSGRNHDGWVTRRYTGALHHWCLACDEAVSLSLGTGLGHFGYVINVSSGGSPLSISDGYEVFFILSAGAGVRLGDDWTLSSAFQHQESIFKNDTEMNRRFVLATEWRFVEAWRIAAGYHDDDWSKGTALSLIHDF